MHCPFCRHPDSRVVDSREADEGATIRRRRSCPSCGKRFTTMETASLIVVKRNGTTEPFSRVKVLTGVRKACRGRGVTEDELAGLAQRVEESIRATGLAEIASNEIGMAILPPLQELDEVAWVRFASVYQSFESLDDFETAIGSLRAARETTTTSEAFAGAVGAVGAVGGPAVTPVPAAPTQRPVTGVAP